jgi:hypothetical protein
LLLHYSLRTSIVTRLAWSVPHSVVREVRYDDSLLPLGAVTIASGLRSAACVFRRSVLGIVPDAGASTTDRHHDALARFEWAAFERLVLSTVFHLLAWRHGSVEAAFILRRPGIPGQP